MAKNNNISYDGELSQKVSKLIDSYEEKFGEKPPIVGYLDEDLVEKLAYSIENGKELEGAEEGLYKKLGVKKEDQKTVVI